MAEKKHESSGFTVTDRRLFTSEGELRKDAAQETKEETKLEQPESPKPAPTPSAPRASEAASGTASPVETSDGDAEIPAPPTAAEQQVQADAYKKSSKELDSQVEISGHSAKDLEMTFDRFLASLYMTAMLQLGLMREQGGQPRIDLIGARQTIDTLSLLGEKTKGNLTPREENFLQNSLYELRMAYVEVTNALARPPQPGPERGPAAGTATGTRGR